MIHPWRRLRALTHFTLEWHDGGLKGDTKFADAVITIRRDLTQAQRRSAVLHECLHAERGPVPMGLEPKEEVRVRKLAAHLLLPNIRTIADAMAWAQGDVEAAADELWVDPSVLQDRLDYMTHPGERAYLAQRLGDDHEHHR